MHGRVLGVAGEMIGEQRGDNGLVVRPPEFHVVPILLHGQPLHIAEVEEPAILRVPAPRPHPLEDGLAQGAQACVVAAHARLLQDEPGRLDGMAGVEHAAIEVIEELAVGADRLQHGAQVRLHEIALDLVDTAVDPAVAQFRVTAGLAQRLSRCDQDHRYSQSLHRPHRRVDLRRQRAGRRHQPGHAPEQILRSPEHRRVSRGLRIGGVGNDGEGLAEEVAPLAQRLPLTRDEEEHATIVVEAVRIEKVDAMLGQTQPLRSRLNRVIQCGKHPCEAALQPYRLVRVDDRAVPIHREHVPAMLLIHAMPDPERNHILQQPVTADANQFVNPGRRQPARARRHIRLLVCKGCRSAL